MEFIMKDNPQRFLEVALEAVKKTEPIFRKHFGNASGIQQKGDSRESKVTDSDKEIERMLAEMIGVRFPDHAIVGEEGTARSGSVYTWYIDPIDGTTNYIQGISCCSSSLALWDASGPLVGIVADPVNRVTYTAIRGEGAFRNGVQIHVSSTALMKQGVGSLGWDWGHKESRMALITKIETNFFRWREFGGSALELCFVATGITDFFVSSCINIWDMAAASLIVSEAGGRVSEVNGGSITSFSRTIVATNGKLHQELLAQLK